MNFDQIKEDLDLFSEWEDRYGYIIDLGKQISLPDEKKTDKNKVNGCASQVCAKHIIIVLARVDLAKGATV